MNQQLFVKTDHDPVERARQHMANLTAELYAAREAGDADRERQIYVALQRAEAALQWAQEKHT